VHFEFFVLGRIDRAAFVDMGDSRYIEVFGQGSTVQSEGRRRRPDEELTEGALLHFCFRVPMLRAPAIAQNWGADGKPGSCGSKVNRYGHQVPSPCGKFALSRTAPGSTARCADGTYSFSERPTAPGTCCHHGGMTKSGYPDGVSAGRCC